jgi:hypothetical protein
MLLDHKKIFEPNATANASKQQAIDHAELLLAIGASRFRRLTRDEARRIAINIARAEPARYWRHTGQLATSLDVLVSVLLLDSRTIS